MTMGMLLSIQTGKVAPLGPEGVPSGIAKTTRSGPVSVQKLGLEGDEIADLSVHGGSDKAVYAYAAAHFPAWAKAFPALADHFAAGSMGENLTMAGMEEGEICVGDIHAIGSALLQACQPRQPCFEFALRHGNKMLPKAMVQSGLSGWYYRVIRPGTITLGDAVSLQDRPHPDFAFTRLIAIIYHGGATQDELVRMAAMTGLAAQWRALARQTAEPG